MSTPTEPQSDRPSQWAAGLAHHLAYGPGESEPSFVHGRELEFLPPLPPGQPQNDLEALGCNEDDVATTRRLGARLAAGVEAAELP